MVPKSHRPIWNSVEPATCSEMQQSGGKTGLKLLRVVKDVKIIEQARAEATQLVAADPDLLGFVQLAGAVLDFTRGNEMFLTSN